MKLCHPFVRTNEKHIRNARNLQYQNIGSDRGEKTGGGPSIHCDLPAIDFHSTSRSAQERIQSHKAMVHDVSLSHDSGWHVISCCSWPENPYLSQSHRCRSHEPQDNARRHRRGNYCTGEYTSSAPCDHIQSTES